MQAIKRGFAHGRRFVAMCAACLPAQEVVSLPAADRLLEADLQDVHRIGGADGEEWESFGGIDGLAFDDEGKLYVFDGISLRIVVVGPDGGFVQMVGRKGDGPGELRSAAGVRFAVLGNGRVVVYEMFQRAFQVYGPTGDFERMVPMGTGALVGIQGLQATADGGVISTGVVDRGRWGEEAGSPSSGTRGFVERFVLEGEEAASEAVAEAWRPDDGQLALAPALFAGVLPDGSVAFSDSSAYAIKIAAGDGNAPSRVLARPFRPGSVTDRVREAYRQDLLAQADRIERNAERAGLSGLAAVGISFLRREAEEAEFYHEVPVIGGLKTGWEGAIWVQRNGDVPGEDGPIDILTADGRYVGTLAPGSPAMPDAFGPRGLVAWEEADEFDVPVVVVRRLPAELRTGR